MSTSATGTANGSTGRSTKGAQSVHLASGGTAGRGTACRDSGTTTAGTGLPVAGEHVPIMHLTASLPAPTGVVPKIFQGVTLEDRRSQATEIYELLNTPSPSLPCVKKGAKFYADLVNVLNTSLVILIYCMGMVSSPIGENASPVDGEPIFLQGDSNADLSPPQTVYLPDTVFEPNTVVVMTVAQLSTRITSKVAGRSYPLLARNAVNTSGEIMQIAPIPPYFVYGGFEQDLDAALVL